MSRHALTGIGQAIRANTTEKSIDQLRAEGKKRVRVVSSERVMAIIQAIVDDTINSEVGAITKRDRDGIVRETQERFSHVLGMQQDLEQTIEELRTTLSSAELERDRLMNDKTLLETQLESARRVDGSDSDLKRVSSDLAGVKDAVARLAHSSAGAADEAALAKMVEKLAAHDAQAARRHSAEIDDLRERLGNVVRDISASRDAAIEASLQRARQQSVETDAAIALRIDRDLKSVADQLTTLRETVARAPGADEAVSRLRANVDGLDKRLQGIEKTSAELGARVAETVYARLRERDAAVAAGGSDALAAHTAAFTDALRKLQQTNEEGQKSLVREFGAVRESTEEAQTHLLSIQAEQFRDLERRLSGAASERAAATAMAAEQTSDRTAALDGALQGLRRELASFAERAVTHSTSAAVAVTEAIGDLRAHAKSTASRTESIDEALKGLRGDLTTFADRVATQAGTVPAAVTDALADVRNQSKSNGARAAALEESLKTVRGDVASMAERVAAHSMSASAAVSQALGDLRSHTKAVAERTSELDMSIGNLRADHAAHAEKIVALSSTAPPEITDALDDLRSHAQESVRRTAEAHDALSRRLDTTIVDLRGDFAALSAKSAEAAERSHESVRNIGGLIAQAATVQSDTLQSSFKEALERALDKIERTMQAATAKPIEMTGEATDVLLAKIFDDPDSELSSNYDQLDVAQRRTGASIAKSVGRLKQMGGTTTSSTEKNA